MPFFQSEENEVYESPPSFDGLENFMDADGRDFLARSIRLLISSHEILRQLRSMRFVQITLDQPTEQRNGHVLYLWMVGDPFPREQMSPRQSTVPEDPPLETPQFSDSPLGTPRAPTFWAEDEMLWDEEDEELTL